VVTHVNQWVSRAALAALMTAGLSGADNALTPQEKAAGWVLLFDGKTLHGWDSSVPPPASGRSSSGAPKKNAPAQSGAAPAQGSHPRPCSTPLGRAEVSEGASHWEVMDGALSPCGEPAGYLMSKESYRNLVLTVDFRTGEDTNSGVFLRSPGGNLGYEVQIWKAQPAGYNTASIVGAARTEREFKFVPEQWNHYEITADGDHLVVMLNGTRSVDVHDTQFADGRIRLQYQKFPIEFKNIKLRLITH
jgi:hypothetical protein